MYLFLGVEKTSYTVNEYIKNVGKETEESNSTLLLSRLVNSTSFFCLILTLLN